MNRNNKRNLLTRLGEFLPGSFQSSADYWKDRYASGGDSGDGSYGELAAFKADILNSFVKEHDIKTVIEFGCGDGNQLMQAKYPHYLGVDISPDAIALCEKKFSRDESKSFVLAEDYSDQKAELALSLDVVYHLIEDGIFEAYIARCFDSAEKFVIIYASNHDRNPFWQKKHVRHRNFGKWVSQHRPEWKLIATHMRKDHLSPATAATSFADFYVFSK